MVNPEMIAAGVNGGGMFNILATLDMSTLFMFIAVYIYFAFALMTIAKKTKTENAWMAWIPIVNIYLMTQIAKVEWWYVLLILLLPIIPVLGGIASIAITIFIWWKIAESINKPGWWSILLVIPIVNAVIIGIMAWSK